MTESLRRFINGLDRAKPHLTTDQQTLAPGVEDIADMLWFAAQLVAHTPQDETNASPPTENPESGHTAPEGPETPPFPPPSNPNTESLGVLIIQPPPSPQELPQDSVEAESEQSSPPPPTKVDRLKVPAAAALRHPLQLIRALRPLARKVDSRTEKIIDEEATAIAIAEGNPIGVVQQPQQERWLDLELVIEQSRIAALWNRTSKEWADLLTGSGIFRSVRVWTLEGDSTSEPSALQLTSGPPGKTVRNTRRANPKELIDPSGQRLIMFLSDCVSPRWWQGQIQPVLAEWSSKGPVVIVQWFPPEPYWDRTGLKLGYDLYLKALSPGLPNPLLLREYKGLNPEIGLDLLDDEFPSKAAIVPVVSLEPGALGSWSRMVAGYSDAQVSGRRFDLIKDNDQWHGPTKTPRNLPTSGQQRVELFWDTASDLAQELAGLMALGPVSPEITNLIQETLLPQSSPVHVAEVFLSGLLEETEQGYQFVPEAKAKLQTAMIEADEQLVFQVLSQYISERYGRTPREFEVFLQKHTDWEERQWQQVEGFAELRQRLSPPSPFEPYEITYGEWEPEDDSPSLIPEELEFTVAQLVEQTETVSGTPSPGNDPTGQISVDPQSHETETLETDDDTIFLKLKAAGFEVRLVDFEVATVTWGEPDQPELETESLQTTTVETVTVNARGEITKRDQQEVFYFEEPLPGLMADEMPLRMMAIPSGEFLMGSSENEEGHRESETPQHQVSVEPFFMGQFPVTQAQWRVVAGFPKQDISLKADPARFKGANNPVEQVSWQEAVEFCKRLSELTGRLYRLPTEAEWEYACRAGTTTPFYFGETITTDLANYDGNYTYAEAPKGEYRRQTTPVGQFPPNAFGLYDMHGNVWEYCQDYWHGNYKNKPAELMQDGNTGWLTSDESKYHVLRGGSWNSYPRNCRSACRNFYIDLNGGFRVVCEVRGL